MYNHNYNHNKEVFLRSGKFMIIAIVLCASLFMTTFVLLPAFVHASSLSDIPVPTPTPTSVLTPPVTGPDCLRIPGTLDLGTLSANVTQNYAIVQQIMSQTTTEIDYEVSVPVGILPGAQATATLAVSTSIQSTAFRLGTQLLVTASLRDSQTFQALAIQAVNARTYASCQFASAFIDPFPMVNSSGNVVYWQVNSYILSFTSTRFSVDTSRPMEVITQFSSSGIPTVESVQAL